MHNISGLHFKEEDSIVYEGINLFTFSIRYPKKSRFYYVEDKSEYEQWMKVIKQATGFASLSDEYEVKEKLGNGRFGLVKLGVHKKSNREVAIKIMNKEEMSDKDLELVKIEFEIMKICQHKNIIRIYDFYENEAYIYISQLII